MHCHRVDRGLLTAVPRSRAGPHKRLRPAIFGRHRQSGPRDGANLIGDARRGTLALRRTTAGETAWAAGSAAVTTRGGRAWTQYFYFYPTFFNFSKCARAHAFPTQSCAERTTPPRRGRVVKRASLPSNRPPLSRVVHVCTLDADGRATEGQAPTDEDSGRQCRSPGPRPHTAHPNHTAVPTSGPPPPQRPVSPLDQPDPFTRHSPCKSMPVWGTKHPPEHLQGA
jgi:hypothetical protein